MLKETAFAHNEYKKYFQLVHISDDAGGEQRPFLLEAPRLTAVKAGHTHHPPHIEPQSDRMNMATQVPKEENL